MSFDFKKDPLENFLKSLHESQLKGIPDHNSMTLATVNKDHKPSNRIVYYKGLIRGGFSFYTNYNGRKGRDLAENANVSANFFWPHLDHQVRVDGYAEKLTAEESDKYFSSRARISQIGAWTSDQSSQLESFDAFHAKFKQFEDKFTGQKIPRPPHWGGYRIVPLEIEFWFGKTGRLHERYIYTRASENADWSRSLRSP